MAATSRRLLTVVPGLLLMLAAALWSSAGIAVALQGAAGGADPALLQGALLFRIGLFALGALWTILALVPVRPLPASPPAEAVGGLHYIALAVLLILAVWLRLHRLDTGLWYDEMLTHVGYMDLSLGQIVSTFGDANNHVLFSLAARASILLFGDSSWAFRLPAALFGIASVGALYVFARQVASPFVALFSVALVTVSYHHIWFSQNARGYTALLFFSLVSSSFLLAALRSNRPYLWAMFAVSGALGAFTHLSFGFLAIAQFAVYVGTEVAVRRDVERQWWVGFAYGFVPLALLTYVAYALVLPSILGGALLGSGLQDQRLDWLSPLWALAEIYTALQRGFAGGVVGLAAAAVLGVGLVHFLLVRPALVALFLVPCGLGFALMTAIGYTLFPRFFFFAMGFAVIFVIGGAVAIAAWASRLLGLRGTRALWLPTLACLVIVGASVLSLRYVYAPKQAFDRAIAYIEDNRAPGDVVVALGIADFPFNGYYKKGWPRVDTVAELEAIEATGARTWVVYTMPVHARTVYADVLRHLEERYTPATAFVGTLNGGGVIVQSEREQEAG